MTNFQFPISNQKKTVFITGSSSGIGKAAAYRFAQEKYRLVVTYFHNKTAGEKVKQECLDFGAKDVLLVPLDITDNQSIKKAVAEVINSFGWIDILINNAGTLIFGPLFDVSFEAIEQQINTNLTGMIKLTQECLPYVKSSIINIGSTLGLQGHKRVSVYSATKFGIRGFTQSLAKEFPKLKIFTVNPSLTATQMGNFKGMLPEKVAEIIFKSATGKYKAHSGSDINVRDYIYGEKIGQIIKVLRMIKRTIKK